MITVQRTSPVWNGRCDACAKRRAMVMIEAKGNVIVLCYECAGLLASKIRAGV